jgi:hypothetical protein
MAFKNSCLQRKLELKHNDFFHKKLFLLLKDVFGGFKFKQEKLFSFLEMDKGICV